MVDSGGPCGAELSEACVFVLSMSESKEQHILYMSFIFVKHGQLCIHLWLSKINNCNRIMIKQVF